MGLQEETLELLRADTPLFARTCCKIVDKRSMLVPVEPRGAQLKINAVIEAQRDAGLPQRVAVLKSRRTGISTWGQIEMVKRAILRAHRRLLTVAQDNDTAGELHDIGFRVYSHLPAELQPGIIGHSRSHGGRKYLHFGNPARNAQTKGDLGIDSLLSIDTAKEVAAGRGKTLSDLWLSEVAFWPDSRKMLSLMSAVADEPDTLIVAESTANGHNFWKAFCDRARRGEGSFEFVFIGWLEDPDCYLPFPNEEARADFEAQVGTGPWGEQEPELVEMYGATLEQLHWRRRAIVDKAEGKLEYFMQEFPHTPEAAFMASGKHVFSMVWIQRCLQFAERHDPQPGQDYEPRPKLPPASGEPAEITDTLHVPPLTGVLRPSGHKTRKVAGVEYEIPSGALWTPREATGFGLAHPWWKVWEQPRAGAQYVIGVDAASGEENSTGETAYSAIEVVDHRTREQVAEYASRADSDQIALEVFLAGLWFNEALVAVETTGGWGIPIVRALWKRFGYKAHRIYTRSSPEVKHQKPVDRMGWDTNRRTKPLIEDGMREMLREETHGIRSRVLALELTTYVKDDRGRTGPDEDAFSDRLMAYMIAQEVARERPLLTAKDRSRATTNWAPRNPVTGW